MTTFEFEAIGTSWQIDVDADLNADSRAALLETIINRIQVFDKDYSRFRADSLVTKMAKEPALADGREYLLSDDAAPLFSLYKKLYDLTDHAFTPLIGQVLADAGYDADYSLVPQKLHQPPAWDAVISYHHPRLKLKQPALLDFGAAGKGYLIDIVAEILRSHNIHSFCIDAGGDIVQQSQPPKLLRVGLEHPENPKQVIGVATIENQSICGSAGNRRRWDKFHHVINPKTLTSPQNILAIWVTAKTALVADGIATALFFVKAERLLADFQFEYLIVFQDYTIEKSPNFSAELFTI